jgi:hypothetical protein
LTIIPERILHNALVTGLRQFRSNPKLLAYLFQSLTEPEFESIVKFITKTPIDICINYPRKELTPPSIVLLLKSESESETFLGDFEGYGNPPPEHVYDTSGGHAASTSKVQGLPEKVFGPEVISGASTNTVFFDSNTNYLEFVTSDDTNGELKLYVVGGAGKGRTYQINRINSEYVDIEGQFSVPLDNTSVVDIRKSNTALSIGEPARVFDQDALLYRHGANFLANYDLDVVAGSPEQVIYLTSVIKAIFFANKAVFEDQGLQALEISGTDFAPRRDFLPDEVYCRQLNIRFHYNFSILVEQRVYDELQLSLCDGTSLGTITLED